MTYQSILNLLIAITTIDFIINKVLGYLNNQSGKQPIPDSLDGIYDDEKYKKSHYKKIEKDIAYQLAIEVYDFYKMKFSPGIKEARITLDSLNRVYMLAQIEMQPKKKIYPDANMSLRVSYGNVDGYQPDDAVTFNYFTTLDGIMEKEDPDIYDYVVELFNFLFLF